MIEFIAIWLWKVFIIIGPNLPIGIGLIVAAWLGRTTWTDIARAKESHTEELQEMLMGLKFGRHTVYQGENIWVDRINLEGTGGGSGSTGQIANENSKRSMEDNKTHHHLECYYADKYRDKIKRWSMWIHKNILNQELYDILEKNPKNFNQIQKDLTKLHKDRKLPPNP